MSKIADMLDPTRVAALQDIVVVKASTDPNPPAQDTPSETTTVFGPEGLVDAEVTVINGVEYDLRSEGFIDTACADCGALRKVEVAPRRANLAVLASRPRVIVCPDCGEARVRGRRGVVVHRSNPNPKEMPMIDLTKYSEAELAALAVQARNRMVADAAEALPAKREKAKEAEAEREAADAALKARDRAKGTERKKWMGSFTIYAQVGPELFERHNPKTVPALDLSEVDLDEVVSSKVRSPYNKALSALGEPVLDKETTTWRVLRKLHKRLWKAAHVAYDMPKVAESKGERLVAEIEPDAKAKIEAYAKVAGKSFDEAREHLAGIGLL